MTCHLLRALSILLPDSVTRVISQRPWHSLSFSGQQVELSAIIAGESHWKRAAEFDRILSDHNFQLSDALVAEIAVTERVTGDQETRLIIHALLLDA
jgi:hypothetical protein